ncbi:hypothetical protein NL295_26730, partial [Klebsiella pneumoniae]|nr:hypothetical protein [Klebsiella pneumoniae]
MLISESAWEEMTCLFAPSLANPQLLDKIDSKNVSTLPSQFTLER